MNLRNYSIKKANREDLNKIVDFYLFAKEKELSVTNGEFWENKVNKIQAKDIITNWFKNNDCILIAENNKKEIVGFLSAMLVNLDPIMKLKTVCGLTDFFVLKKNPKISKDLILEMIRNLKGKTKLFTIHIANDDKKILSWFEKLGFRKSLLELGIEINKKNKYVLKELENTRIRLASKKDIPILVNLDLLFEKEESKIAGKEDFWRRFQNKSLIKKDILDLFKDNNNYYFLIEYKNKIAGFANAYVEEMPIAVKAKKACSLRTLYILPQYRNMGLSKMLINKIILDIKENFFIISVSPNNYKAISIYSKLGFKPLYLCLGLKNYLLLQILG